MKRFASPRAITLFLVLAVCACGGSSGTNGSSDAQTGSGQGGAGAAGGAGGGGGAGGIGGGMGGAGGESGVGGSFVGSGGASAMVPVRSLPGLTSITFYERTGGTEPMAYTFQVDGPELGARLTDPLAAGNMDITGTSVEFYDVYYSDKEGNFELDGSYLTISGTFEAALPAGGGLNLAEIGLNYVDASTEYGNYVASFVALGDNADPASVPKCIDGDLQTHTTMGNTVGSAERLRLTLGFSSSSGVPK